MKSQTENISRRRVNTVDQKKQQKKIIFAVCLLAIMGILWIRVFGKKKPSTAAAISSTASSQQAQDSQDKGIVYKNMSYVKGRHDKMARDIFSSRNWRGFVAVGHQAVFSNTEMDQESSDSEFSVEINAAAKDMELIAIVSDNGLQAFIENQLLSKGQSFNYKFQSQKYEFTVVDIYDNGVVLNCNGVTVTKKMPKPDMGDEQ